MEHLLPEALRLVRLTNKNFIYKYENKRIRIFRQKSLGIIIADVSEGDFKYFLKYSDSCNPHVTAKKINEELALKGDEIFYEHNEKPSQEELIQEPQVDRELTFGEKLVGLTFNPSGDPKVHRAKQLCAELADLLHKDFQSSEFSVLKIQLYNNSIGEILNAQMNVVKVLTFKY
jgi:hypothetical protein